jgi:hypothetical protein
MPTGSPRALPMARARRAPSRAPHAGRWTATIAVELPDAAPLPATGRRCWVDVGPRSRPTPARWQRPPPASMPPIGGWPEPSAARTGATGLTPRWPSRRPRGHGPGPGPPDQCSHDLVREHDLIAVEDLRVTNMTRSAAVPSRPSRGRQFLRPAPRPAIDTCAVAEALPSRFSRRGSLRSVAAAQDCSARPTPRREDRPRTAPN